MKGEGEGKGRSEWKGGGGGRRGEDTSREDEVSSADGY